MLPLSPRRLSRRNDANHRATTIAMTYNQRVQVSARAEKNKSIFGVRVLRIFDQQGMLIRKHRFGFMERNPVFANVLLILSLVPLELNALNMYIIFTLYVFVKALRCMSNTSICCGPQLFHGLKYSQRPKRRPPAARRVGQCCSIVIDSRSLAHKNTVLSTMWIQKQGILSKLLQTDRRVYLRADACCQ